LKSIFIELTSLFLVNFHVSILYESHHLLLKRSCKTDGENLDGLRARLAVCVFAACIPVEQDVIVTVIMIAFSIFTHF